MSDSECYVFKMRNRLAIAICFTLLCAFACNKRPANNLEAYRADSVKIVSYIAAGNAIYSAKQSTGAFFKSMEYYDSAYKIALQLKDTFLIAKTVFAKGRAYDALNLNPQKTINYYREAARLYQTFPRQKQLALYLKHLVAHSYDKVKDSVHCIAALKELYDEIASLPDSVRKRMTFIAEMALISTEVNNYTMADSILQHLTRREWIYNDSTEYDYLNHYYLTRARMDIYAQHYLATPFLDSVEMVYRTSKNFSDSLFFSNQLRLLYADCGNPVKAGFYSMEYFDVLDRARDLSVVKKIQERLSEMEMFTVKLQQENEKKRLHAMRGFFITVVVLLGIISLLVIFLITRLRLIETKKNELYHANEELFASNMQNSLLNKELQHRVKNNLQLIISLAHMQQRNATTAEAKEHLHKIEQRIKSIAALHEQIAPYGDKNIDLREYFTWLVNTVAGLAGVNATVRTHIDIENVKFTAKQSLAIGLLVNEWVTNSVKYGRVHHEPLHIYLSLKNKNGEVRICYKNSGKPQHRQQVKAGLGTTIINLLVAQLEGRLEQDDHNFFYYRLTIPAIQ